MILSVPCFEAFIRKKINLRESARNLRICDGLYQQHWSAPIKKLDIQEKQLKDTEKREKFRVYGELINTYGYNIPEVQSLLRH